MTVVETEDFLVHENEAPVSSLHGTPPDSAAHVYCDDTELKTAAGYRRYSGSLSEGTITDSTPCSAVVYHHTPSIEEGTILSSVSSYRSITERPPGLSH